jgi:hypothetical protein
VADAAAGRGDVRAGGRVALLNGVGGRYFEDCNEAETLYARGDKLLHGVAAYALDLANAARPWNVTEQMLSAHPVA